MKISVYITSYNQKAYLGEAIDSVLAQTLQPYEIIVVDDASGDGSQSLIAGYVSRYPGLVKGVYHPLNQGVAAARNTALANATGDFVTYVDGDDRFQPGKLKTEARRLAETPGAGLVYSGVRIIDAHGQPIDSWGLQDGLPEGDIFEAVFGRQFPRRQLFRSELVDMNAWRQIGFYDPTLAVYEDYEMRIRLSRHLRAAACRQALSEHRRHAGGLSRRPAEDFLQAFIYLREKHQPLLDSLPAGRREPLVTALDSWQARLVRRVALEKAAGGDRGQAWELYRHSQTLDPGLDSWFLAQYFLPPRLAAWLREQRWRTRQRRIRD